MAHDPVPTAGAAPFDPFRIERPDPALRNYYIICSLILGPFFFLALIPLMFKYETLRFRFDNEGISMSWGYFWRKEILLTYRRIQDIHLTRNILQRWMGLATVAVQTASGSATAEMSIEGILQAEQLRDFLYVKMRGARGLLDAPAATVTGSHEPVAAAHDGHEHDEALTLLREIRDALKRLPREREVAS